MKRLIYSSKKYSDDVTLIDNVSRELKNYLYSNRELIEKSLRSGKGYPNVFTMSDGSIKVTFCPKERGRLNEDYAEYIRSIVMPSIKESFPELVEVGSLKLCNPGCYYVGLCIRYKVKNSEN